MPRVCKRDFFYCCLIKFSEDRSRLPLVALHTISFLYWGIKSANALLCIQVSDLEYQ